VEDARPWTADSKARLLSIGELQTLLQPHLSIPHWDFSATTRSLPLSNPLGSHWERMVIRDFVSVLKNSGVLCQEIGGGTLANSKNGPVGPTVRILV